MLFDSRPIIAFLFDFLEPELVEWPRIFQNSYCRGRISSPDSVEAPTRCAPVLASPYPVFHASPAGIRRAKGATGPSFEVGGSAQQVPADHIYDSLDLRPIGMSFPLRRSARRYPRTRDPMFAIRADRVQASSHPLALRSGPDLCVAP